MGRLPGRTRPEGRLAPSGAATELRGMTSDRRARVLARREPIAGHRMPDVAHRGRKVSTQQALRATCSPTLARDPALGERIVTASPDVAVSTNLGGWINRVGVYSADDTRPIFDDAPRLLQWQPSPAGQHIELGISEMNLFMMLGQFGLTAELFGEPLIPIGTVYDPFIARGLDALIYALYIESRFILVAHAVGRVAGAGGRRAPVDHHALAGHRAARPAQLRAGLRQEVGVVPAGGDPRAVLERGARASPRTCASTTRPVDQSLADARPGAPR